MICKMVSETRWKQTTPDAISLISHLTFVVCFPVSLTIPSVPSFLTSITGRFRSSLCSSLHRAPLPTVATRDGGE